MDLERRRLSENGQGGKPPRSLVYCSCPFSTWSAYSFPIFSYSQTASREGDESVAALFVDAAPMTHSKYDYRIINHIEYNPVVTYSKTI
jgi:hypothetical protein